MRPTLRWQVFVATLAFASSPSWGQSGEQMNEANNPLTPKIGVNFQDQYVDRLYDVDGWNNAFLLRSTIPHKLGGIGQILRIKRLFWLADGRLRIVSDNKAYAEEIVNSEEIDRVVIIGQVMHKMGEGGL